MENYQNYKNQILNYFYILEDDYIKTYGVIQKEKKFYKILINRFNYDIYGEKIIEKLRGRGYLSKKECDEIYGYELINLEKVKTKKKLFRKRK